MELGRLHNLDLIMVCGLYGAGKTGFGMLHFREKGRLRISRSEIRKHLYEMMHYGEPWSPGEFNEEDDILVKHIERKMVEHFVHHKRKILIVNTFVTRKSRERIVKIAKSLKKTVGIIFLNTPFEKCIERNRENRIKVTDSIVVNLSAKLELPDKSEGFDEILVLDNYNPGNSQDSL